MNATLATTISREDRFALARDLEIFPKEQQSDSRKYYCRHGKRSFYIGSMFGDFLFRLRNGDSFYQALVHTAREYDVPQQDFASMVRENLIERGLVIDQYASGTAEPESPDSYIKAQVPLLNERMITAVAGVLQHVYHPMMVVLLIGFALFSYGMLFAHFGMDVLSPGRLAIVPMLFDGNDYMLFMGSMLAIYLFHEFGHAAAARYHNVRIRRVGFGIYVVFPVFFTDISDAWAISTKKRLVLNLGGVYFQFLVSLFAVWWALLTDSEVPLFILMVNFWSISICLLPFVRFDGYWIYSDLFNIPNLWTQAFETIRKLSERGKQSLLSAINRQIEESPELMAYCVTSFLFLCIFSVVIFRAVMAYLGSIGITVEQITALITSPQSGISDYTTAFFHVFFVFFVGLILTVLSRNILRTLWSVGSIFGTKKA